MMIAAREGSLSFFTAENVATILRFLFEGKCQVIFFMAGSFFGYK